MPGSKIYLDVDVLTKAKERISLMFDEFENIVVSVSGGKDSSTMFNLVYQEAQKRNRKINVFFLDQEAEYQSTIDIIEHIFQHNINPYWYQIPLYLTNATSYGVRTTIYSVW